MRPQSPQRYQVSGLFEVVGTTGLTLTLSQCGQDVTGRDDGMSNPRNEGLHVSATTSAGSDSVH
jgi:hypothetical protein